MLKRLFKCSFNVHHYRLKIYLRKHRQRPYHVEHTSSRPITEVKQHWAWLVLGWETAWEYRVLLFFFFLIPESIFCFKYNYDKLVSSV